MIFRMEGRLQDRCQLCSEVLQAVVPVRMPAAEEPAGKSAAVTAADMQVLRMSVADIRPAAGSSADNLPVADIHPAGCPVFFREAEECLPGFP